MPVVSEATSGIDIIDLAEAKAALNIPASNADYDVELAQVVTAASEMLDRWVGAVVVRTVSAEVHHGSQATVTLDVYPVVSITAFDEWDGSTTTALTANTFGTEGDYDIDLASGVVTRVAAGYPSRFARNGVRVTYTAGRFANTASVDAIYKEACASIVTHLWQKRGSGDGIGVVGGDGQRFGGVPYSVNELRRQVLSSFSDGVGIA